MHIRKLGHHYDTVRHTLECKLSQSNPLMLSPENNKHPSLYKILDPDFPIFRSEGIYREIKNWFSLFENFWNLELWDEINPHLII